MATPAPTRRRLPPEERKAMILDSALRTFSQRGYHAASVDEIARGAGITKAVVYDHFASKRDIYDAAVTRELQEVFRRMAEVPDEGGPVERLTRSVDAFLRYVHARPESRRVMLETIDAEPEMGGIQRQSQMLATQAIASRLGADPDLLRDAPDRDLALEMVAQMFKSAVNGIADWWYDHPEVPLDVVRDRLVAFLLQGLSAFWQAPSAG